ncbi:hypothetical protein C8R47DRAFT_1255368 [Mycena vitilis]|nr:hypothetical protein C8R47DRAFT_1262574 [Mycena vitilis]KAJ6501038.1 hypothetical protein C8R47DRAFT_1255368 [Mycena vitilis]
MVAELVDMICAQFDLASADWRNYRALGALARTCTAFRDPALDRLWRSTTLVQLLTSCMPSELWAFDMRSRKGCSVMVSQRTLTLLRPIRDSDWRRVRLYAPRIRKLTSGQDRCFLDHIFPSLSLAFPESLLQNLQHLRWCHHNDFDFPYITTFLRPSLTHISFELLSTSDFSLLPRLGERCPHLAGISIAAGPGVDLQPLSYFVAHLPTVRTLSIPWLGQDTMEHLSKLPTLNSLTIESIPEALAVSPVRVVPAFPALQHLSIHEGMLVHVTQFLGMCNDVPLETFSVARNGYGGPDYPPAADMDSFFATLEARVSHSTLRRLHVDGYNRWSDTPEPELYPVRRETIALLLCFKNLTYLHLTSSLGFDLDDDIVSRMARSWPQIERLHLAGIQLYARRPRTTLASLCSIARHCPRIVALTIAFDGSQIVSPSSISPGVVVHNKSLRDMDVLHSPIAIGTSISMRRFLSGVFPNLTWITTSREFMDNEDEAQLREHEEAIRYHKRWKDVWQNLKPQWVLERARGNQR